jgi:hypothetical protein
MTACISIPQPPPPPSCVIYETQSPWISGTAAVGETLTMNGGSWQPSCGGGLSAADIHWSDDSHSATYVVKPSDQGTTVCATVTVWDYNGASASDGACIAVPATPPPPPPPPPSPDTTPPTVGITGPAAGSVSSIRLRSRPMRPTTSATAATVTVTVSDGVTDGEGVDQTSPTLTFDTACSATAAAADPSAAAAPACVANAACTGPRRALGTAAAPAPGQAPITYRNRITQLVYWKAAAAVDVCIDTQRHEIVGFSGARVVPLYTLPFVWSYDNSPHWSYGPTGKGVRTTWVQVTDSFSGCPFKIRFGCNIATFTVVWTIQGNGKYTWSVRFV